MIPFNHVLLLAAVLFCLGLVCLVTRKSLIMTLVGLEIMMNAAALAFIGAALHRHQLEGQAFVLFIMGVAATEVAVGLVLVMTAYKKTGTIDPDRYHHLKG